MSRVDPVLAICFYVPGYGHPFIVCDEMSSDGGTGCYGLSLIDTRYRIAWSGSDTSIRRIGIGIPSSITRIIRERGIGHMVS